MTLGFGNWEIPSVTVENEFSVDGFSTSIWVYETENASWDDPALWNCIALTDDPNTDTDDDCVNPAYYNNWLEVVEDFNDPIIYDDEKEGYAIRIQATHKVINEKGEAGGFCLYLEDEGYSCAAQGIMDNDEFIFDWFASYWIPASFEERFIAGTVDLNASEWNSYKVDELYPGLKGYDISTPSVNTI